MSAVGRSPASSRLVGTKRRLNDFCIGFWNETENWNRVNEECRVLLEEIVNARAILNGAKHQAGDLATAKDEGEQMLCEPSKSSGSSGTSSLSELERYRLNEAIIRQSEHLVAEMETRYPKIVRRMNAAVEKIPAIRSYVVAEASPEDANRFAAVVETASDVYPKLSKMYEKELAAKRTALCDLAAFDDHKVSMAVVASWLHEAFVDHSLKLQAYACASEFEE
ncbi:hypothetical protein QR680_012960 [Steinernema hermaphroditum]|uniref:Uncharacterized protein n=1 Tax=Steinernema hermaphroditum TaxID=289476 RepID=A0AA39I3X2_9BILA|nr:hypothetical protein QR680_012960 [Steinernema hermaphroditum]